MSKQISVFDPLYGRFELPALLEPFLSSPEFARLGGVRLLNFDSIELAALSEVRRRSHTLGVLHLCTRLSLLEFAPDEMKALLFAAVLHDIGTPPFGHSLEYEYIRRLGQNHEAIATRLLDGEHNSLALDHQIHGEKTPRLPTLVRATGVEPEIRAILGEAHPLSTLLFGDLDLDNIDNVFRMAWYLGERCDPSDAIRLASSMDVDRTGRKLLGHEHRPLVERWLRLRALAYKRLLDSPLHRRNQAVFSRIVYEAMEGEPTGTAELDVDDWFLTDERLMERLRRLDRLKPFFADLDRRAPLPEVGMEFELSRRMVRGDLTQNRDALVVALTEVTHRPIYVALLPYGETLERRVTFLDRQTGDTWSVGAPRLTYRLQVHIGGSLKAGEAAVTKRSVLRIINEYAEQRGWIGQTEPRPAAIGGDQLEF